MGKVFYWANVLGGIEAILIAFLIVAILTLAVWVGFWIAEINDYHPDEESLAHYRKGTLRTLAISTILSLGIIFIPDKDTYLLMEGSKAVEELYHSNESFKELPSNTIDFLNTYVKTLTKELEESQVSE